MSKDKKQTGDEKPGTDLYKLLHSDVEPGTRLYILKQNAELLQHSPIEWLQYIAEEFSDLAGIWGRDSNTIEEMFEYCKESRPKLSKIKMFEYVTNLLPERFWSAYIRDIGLLVDEIELLRENILKAFETTAIFPNLLNAIGIFEFVIREARDYEDSFSFFLYYQNSYDTSEETIKEWYGESAVKRRKQFTKLTINDYENAFEHIKLFIKIMEKGRYSEKMRDLSFAIKGYCKLKSENYAVIEAQIAKRYEIAYQSFQYAEEKTGNNLTDKQAYEYLKEHGVENIEGFELPDDFDTWRRYVREGRRHHGTPKNTFRTGRACGSAVKISEVDVRQITNRLNNSTDTD